MQECIVSLVKCGRKMRRLCVIWCVRHRTGLWEWTSTPLCWHTHTFFFLIILYFIYLFLVFCCCCCCFIVSTGFSLHGKFELLSLRKASCWSHATQTNHFWHWNSDEGLSVSFLLTPRRWDAVTFCQKLSVYEVVVASFDARLPPTKFYTTKNIISSKRLSPPWWFPHKL